MHYITYEEDQETKLGLLKDGELVIELQKLSSIYNNKEVPFLQDMLTFIQEGEASRVYVEKLLRHFNDNEHLVSQVTRHVKEVKVLAPIQYPQKVVCVGNNYMDHCKEQNVDPPKKPLIFSKWASCIIAPEEDIQLPDESEQVDFEAELAVIIGKKGKNICEEEADEYIFGYTIMNDVSARDVQFGDGQWVRGKSFDTFAPLGPVIVSKDEIKQPQNLHITFELNGEILQNSNTKHMIFSIPYIISYLSKGFTFEPGDVIATGTPHGVGVFRNPPIFLKAGDVCTIEIEKIGVLQNKVKGAS